MAKMKLNASTIAVVAVVGIAGIVAADFFVLHGRLGIASKLRGILQKITGNKVNLEVPIIPSDLPEEGLGPSEVSQNPDLEAQLMAEEEDLAAMEPETASWARRRAYRGSRRRVRLGGYGI